MGGYSGCFERGGLRPPNPPPLSGEPTQLRKHYVHPLCPVWGYFDIGLAGHGDRKKHSQEPRALRQEIREMRKKIGFPFPGPRTDGSHPSPWVWRLGTGLYTVYVPGAVRNLVSPAADLRSCSPHCNSPEPSADAVTLGRRVTLPVLASQSPIRSDSGMCTVGVLRTVDIR